jgi:hypothetical protein
VFVAAFACGDSRGEAMKYPVEVIATRFGSPPGSPRTPSLVVVHGAAAWARLAARDVSLPGLVPAEFDWSRKLVLWVKTSADGGADVEPVITELSREGDRVRVQVETRLRPDAEGLDSLLQPWLFAAAPRAAFEGKPEIELEVRGQGRGTVTHEAD